MITKSPKSGFIPFPNKLAEVIYSTNFNATQLRILLLIIRYTYGFNRSYHDLSLTFIATGIGATKEYVGKELKKLIKANVVRVVSQNTKTEGRELKVNEDYDSWKEFKISYGGVVESDHQEETYLKTNIKTGAYPEFFEEFYKEYPKSENKPLTFHEWKVVTREHDPEAVIKAAKKYKREIASETDPQFIIRSYNFLGKLRYLDYLSNEEPERTSAIVQKPFNQNDWM